LKGGDRPFEVVASFSWELNYWTHKWWELSILCSDVFSGNMTQRKEQGPWSQIVLDLNPSHMAFGKLFKISGP
jgi:hypothetical protein